MTKQFLLNRVARAAYPAPVTMQKTILIADDDPHIREILVFCLEKAGFRVVQARNGKETVETTAREMPSLIVLDIGMPEMDGLEVCRRIRRDTEVPIIFLSSRDDEIDRVVGLEIGGDDYVTKPFSPRELVARVQAVLKRTGQRPAAEDDANLAKGALMLDPDGYRASWQGNPVALTRIEFLLLEALLRHPGRVFSRDQLMDKVYRDIVVSDRTIDSHVRRIRQKFAEAGASSVVETLHGIGYKLGDCS